MGDKVEQELPEDLSEDTVNPWNVTSKTEKGVDYDKLIGKCGVYMLPHGRNLSNF